MARRPSPSTSQRTGVDHAGVPTSARPSPSGDAPRACPRNTCHAHITFPLTHSGGCARRGFTPRLAEAYTKDLKAKGLEVVFVSSDRDEGAFESYFGEQPWTALPYGERSLKGQLSSKYKVQGIPTLVILDGETGDLITRDGREEVSKDPTGARFPWKPPTFWEALGEEFLSGTDGETIDLDELKAGCQYIGLYFSAHWCGPCRGFTPSLVSAYKEHLKAKGLEVIFVSSDRDQKAFLEYFGEMPWLAIPNGDQRKNALSKKFGVEGIPSFVIVDAKTGQTITTEARGDVSADPTGAEFPWKPKALNNLSAGKGISGINEELSLIALLDGCDEATKASAIAALEPLATARKEADEATLFFYAPTADPGSPIEQVRKLCRLPQPSGKPQLILLDIPDGGGFYESPAEEVTAETVVAFLDGYKAKALERKQLG